MSNFLREFLAKMNPGYKPSIMEVGKYRYPSPGSKGTYVPPPPEAGAISKNYYYLRDKRRNYPPTIFYENEMHKAITQGKVEMIEDKSGVVKEGDQAKPNDPMMFSAERLPPTPHGRKHKYVDNSNEVPFRTHANTFYNKG